VRNEPRPRRRVERTVGRAGRGIARLLSIAAVATLGATIAPVAATADVPFLWSAPVPIVTSGAYLSGINCSTTPLCVAVDHKGDLVQSLTLTAESTGWIAQNPSGVELAAVSCASEVFCVAVARDDSILYSEDATAAHPTWTREEHADHSGSPLSAVSCTSLSFCVAADEAGHILATTDPAGGTWSVEAVDEPGRTGRAVPIYGISCPTEELCVASDGAGRILTSTNPTGGQVAWHTRSVEANVTIWGISCASASICVAVDGGGNVLTSTDPAAEAWVANFRVDTHPLTSVSCVPPAVCVASDEAGNVVTSSAATGGVGAWSVTSIDGDGHQLTGVSCASVERCFAIDNAGNVLIGTQAPAHTLSVAVDGTGSGTVTGAGISCPGSCSSSEPNGASVVLTQAPNAGSGFIGWSGACTGTGPCDLTMSSDESVTANFAAKPVGSPAGSGSGGGQAPGGSAGSGGAKGASVTIAGAIVALPNGVGMPLHCWAKTGSCPPTTLTLSIVETLHGTQVVAVAAGHSSKPRKKTLIIGTTTITLRAGQTATVHVELNRAGRAQLSRLHRLSALLQIKSPTGPPVWKQVVGLFQKTKRKHS
jgi:hypothetical protein